MDQKTGTAAILSILAAIGSYLLTCVGNPGWALLCAILSIPLGLIGLVMAASPKVSGGILSIAAIVLGALAAVISLLAFIGVATFRLFGA